MVKELRISKELVISTLGCAFHSPSGSVLLADLHIGYETVLEGEGFAMPRVQNEQMLERINAAIDRFDPDSLIIVGDFKHNFDRNLSAEWNGVEKMVEAVSKRSRMIVIRGNHDNYLANILSKRGIELKHELLLGDLKIVHGHKTTAPWDGGMVFGHEHPAITLREATGASVKIPCFLYSPDANRLVLPAFSPLALGSDIIRTPDEERMIPLLRNTGTGSYLVYGFSSDQLLNYRSISDLRRIGNL